MSSKLRNIIILIIIIVAAFFAYSYFFVKKTSTDSNLANVTNQSGGVSQTDANSTTTDAGTEANDEYLKQLIALKSIDFNLALFKDDAYGLLKVSNIEISPEPIGRINPFAPLEQQYGGGTTTIPSSYLKIVSQATSTRKIIRKPAITTPVTNPAVSPAN